MTVLVTGDAGYMRSHICLELAEEQSQGLWGMSYENQY